MDAKVHKIAFVIPYYGSFPDYFNLWLISAGYNPTVDFYFVTDTMPEAIRRYGNVKVISLTFEELKERIQTVIGFDIALKEPYKLCDYKPAYGAIFGDFLDGYDFWGYCDIDLIFGNIRQFVTYDILSGYDIVGKQGHMTLFRNTNELNSLFLKKNENSCYNYDDVYKTEYPCHFDEGRGIISLARKYGLNLYTKKQYANLRRKYFHFVEIIEGVKYDRQIFSFYNGELERIYLIDNKICKQPVLYVHLFRRKMRILNEIKEDRFIIIPNEFIPYDSANITADYINTVSRRKFYPYHYKRRIKEIIGKLRKGAIRQRFLRVKKKLFSK